MLYVMNRSWLLRCLHAWITRNQWHPPREAKAAQCCSSNFTRFKYFTEKNKGEWHDLERLLTLRTNLEVANRLYGKKSSLVPIENACLETKSCTFKLSNIIHPSKNLKVVTRNTQFSKANCWTHSAKIRWTTKWRRLLGLFFLYTLRLNLKMRSCLFYLLPSHFSSPLGSLCRFSPKWHSLRSIQAQSQKHSLSPSASCDSLTFTHTNTYTRVPLAGISATLLTGANQSYNTFIISTPPQVPSCWVKSHLGLFECFTALEICNYIMDMGGPGLAGSSHWQLDTKQTRCEQNSTPKKKNRMKTVLFMISV